MNETANTVISASLLRGLTRRRVLGGAVGLGAAAVLGSCGTSGVQSRSASEQAAKDLSKTERLVNWSTWPEYLDVNDKTQRHPTLDQFTKETGIKVKFREEITDNDVIFAKLKPALQAGRDTGRDLLIVTDWMVERLKRLTWIQELDHANIPNLSNLEPALAHVGFDPGRKYSVPWQSGFAGIAYNPKATGGRKVQSVDQLLHDKELRGKVTLLTEMRDTVGLTMLAMGKDPAKFVDADFYAAIDELKAAKSSGQIQAFLGNEYAQGLAAGDIAACMAWTGDVVQLQADNPKLGYSLPPTGHMLWSDNFVIPNKAAHKTNSEKLINFYYAPKVAAEVADYVNYIPPVVGTRQAMLELDPSVAKNQLIFPNAATQMKSHVFRAVTSKEDTEYNAAFQDLMGG